LRSNVRHGWIVEAKTGGLGGKKGGDGKILKNLKKPIDKGRGGWYYVKAVRENGASETPRPKAGTKNFEKSRKKFLTRAGRCGKI
jgi:hypothetical protein